VKGVRVIGDLSIREGGDFVAGANRPGYHLRHVAYPRDFEVDLLADIALVREGDPCPNCQRPLAVSRALELGHIFQLGTHYAEALGAFYLDAQGKAHPLVMGSFGIGLGRLLAAIVEEHHDEQGIVWPAAVAPYAIHLCALARPGDPVDQAAQALYERLVAQGYQVLYDDRYERAGVQFNDADLIGAPIRLTLSNRTLRQEAVELKPRCAGQRRLVPDAQLEAELDALLATLA